MIKLIKNVNLFDGKGPDLIPNCSILIEDNMVLDVISGEISEENADVVIDGKNMTALPGLIDCHTHISMSNTFGNMDTMTVDEIAVRSTRIAEDMLMRGFTSVRDVGGLTLGLKNSIDNGYVKGPRIFTSNSAISQTCGHSDYRQNRAQGRNIMGEESPLMRSGAFRIADGRAEVLKAVREQLFMGASQIKIMAGGGASSVFDPLDTNQFTLDEQKAAVEAAEDYGTYVCAHIHTSPSMKRAAEAGIKCFEHASLMTEDVARIVSDKGIWICGQYSIAELLAERKFPLDSEIQYQKTERIGKGLLKQTEMISKYNLKSVYGTDIIGTKESHDKQLAEFSARKKYFGNLEGLRHATGNANELFKLCTYQNPYPEAEVGVLKKGSFADLIIIDGNPLDDLDIVTDMDNMKIIMKNGEIYKNTLQ